MIISKLMYNFLKHYMKWVEDGSTDGEPYCRKTGLCGNCFTYSRTHYIYTELRKELKDLFESENLDPSFPFGKENYRERVYYGTQHKDPLRLKWVVGHIEEYEKVNAGLVKE